MTADARHLVVGRLRRPHGLKGEMTLFPITDQPEQVFRAGEPLWILDLAGAVVAGPLTVERSRAYHREWLLKVEGLDQRDAWDSWRGLFLGVPEDRLAGPQGDEVYLHELAGFAVENQDGEPLGLVSDVYEMPAGLMIEVQGPKREFLLPYRREFVTGVDRAARRLTVAPPDGLLDE
ncbi:MAG TPA: ribosome maturation factor RimM [Gemmatimonadales bacterium]|nr:ribosome maturation factor RimM [Gemmatimonadales bacterium]